MSRLLRLVSVIKGARSPGGIALADLKTESVFVLDNVLSISMVATRDHANPGVIKGMALLLSGIGGVAAPIATISSMEDASTLALFHAYAGEVLTKVCSGDDVVLIDVKSF